MSDIQEIANNTAKNKGYGIQVLDVRIKKADYPAQVARSVSDRMIADRDKEAALLREQGKEAQRRIENNAIRQARVIVANAREQANVPKVRAMGSGMRPMPKLIISIQSSLRFTARWKLIKKDCQMARPMCCHPIVISSAILIAKKVVVR